MTALTLPEPIVVPLDAKGLSAMAAALEHAQTIWRRVWPPVLAGPQSWATTVSLIAKESQSSPSIIAWLTLSTSPPHNDDVTYNYQEAADRLGCSKNTIYRWIRSGELETVLVGKRRKVTGAAIRKAMENGKTQRP